jgi:hypothetical protein
MGLVGGCPVPITPPSVEVMTTNGTTTRPNTREMSGEVMADAARRMFPVIAGRVLTAVADRAVDRIDQVAGRLDERRTGGGADTTDATDTDDLDDTEDTDGADEDQGTGGGRMGAAFAFIVEQARQLLALVVRLAAQAVEMLRRATERLRARRAPEGIDEAPAPEEISAPEDLEDEDDLEDADDAEYVDEDDDVVDEDEDDAAAEYVDADDDTEGRTTVGA